MESQSQEDIAHLKSPAFFFFLNDDNTYNKRCFWTLGGNQGRDNKKIISVANKNCKGKITNEIASYNE